jgi:hypothetical protein
VFGGEVVGGAMDDEGVGADDEEAGISGVGAVDAEVVD